MVGLGWAVSVWLRATVPVPVQPLALTPSVRAGRPQTEEGALGSVVGTR